MKKSFLILVLFLFSNLTALASEKLNIAFDMDETLISSVNIDANDFDKAEKLGYLVHETPMKQKYIIRPEAELVIKYARAMGFGVILMTHNNRYRALDILEDAHLIQYFDSIKSNENMQEEYNKDFEKYPQHRNKTYEQRPLWKHFTVDVYENLIVKSFKHYTGNPNVHGHLPKRWINKYPPVYGARVLVDNADYNLKNAMDFVAVEVSDFYGTDYEKLANKPVTFGYKYNLASPKYEWSNRLIKLFKDLEEKGWIEVYKELNGKTPVINQVPVIN
jgi:hypothetical protein